MSRVLGVSFIWLILSMAVVQRWPHLRTILPVAGVGFILPLLLLDSVASKLTGLFFFAVIYSSFAGFSGVATLLFFTGGSLAWFDRLLPASKVARILVVSTLFVGAEFAFHGIVGGFNSVFILLAILQIFLLTILSVRIVMNEREAHFGKT